MKLKKLFACAMALLLFSGTAMAQVSFEGKVISSQTQVISAPFGGLIDSVAVRKGELIHVGDPVATIQTTKVYAEMDGTISGVFAREGDGTEGVTTRYGGVMYIEPTNKYVVSATTEKAYNSSATKYVHIGEKVYLSCTKDGTHVGTAVVTSVKEVDESGNTPYTLEVTSGEFYMGETVGIFRESDYAATSRIGRGTIQQNAAVAVKGSGSVLRLDVEVGDRVERGEVLFETVEGVLDGLYAMDNTIVSGVDGIVAEVEAAQGGSATKGGKLISVYPRDAMQIEMKISEMDMNDIHEGDKVSIEFEWDADGVLQLDGVVSGIAYVGETKDGASDASYSAYVDFTPVDSVRMGMTVVVYVMDTQDAEDIDDMSGADADAADAETTEE